MRSKDLHALMDSAKIVSETGLAVSVITDQRAFKEELAAGLLLWLVEDILQFFSSKFKFVSAGKTLEWNSLDVFVKKMIESELYGEMKRSSTQREPDVFMIENISTITRAPISDFSYSSLYTSRLHFLLIYDTKLWKIPRSHLRQLLINCFIMLDEHSKKILGA